MSSLAQRLLLSPAAKTSGHRTRTALASSSSSFAAAPQRLQGYGIGAGQSSKPGGGVTCLFGSKASTADKQAGGKQERPLVEEGKAQVLHVYEINDLDRYSPAVLGLARSPYNLQAPALTNVVDAAGNPVLAIGDLVPFSNKTYDGSLTVRLGITAGISSVIRTVPEKNGQIYEASYSFYFGDYGHISVQGPYLTYQDTELAVTGGSGIFRGVYGYVKLHQIVFPTKLFYTFHLFGIAKLPGLLQKKHVEPGTNVAPSAAAKAGAPEASLPNYTD